MDWVRFILPVIVWIAVTLSASLALIHSNRTLFQIAASKSTVIIGDSHLELALDDSILTNSVNLASRAEVYLFNYIKLRKVLDHNPHLKKVILGYAYHNLKKDIDRIMMTETYLISRLERYGFIMNRSDWSRFIRIKPHYIIKGFWRIYKRICLIGIRCLRHVSYRDLDIGGFYAMTTDRLDWAKAQLEKNSNQPKDPGIASIQIEYLIKIRDLCQDKGVELVLLNTPIHPLLEKASKEERRNYQEIYTQYFNDYTLLDYSGYSMADSCFMDLEHLNAKGARLFSRRVKAEHQL